MEERSRDGRLRVGVVRRGQWRVAKHVDHVRGWDQLICATEAEVRQVAQATLAADERDHPAPAPGTEEDDRGQWPVAEGPERPR